MNVIRLYFQSGLHLSPGLEGKYDESGRILHSDKLKSALFVAAMQLYGKKSNSNEDGIDKAFFENFKLSSAFPFLQLGEEISYFFPLPAIPNPFGTEDSSTSSSSRKQYKAIKYVDVPLLEQLLHGETPQLSRENISKDGTLASLSTVLSPFRWQNSAIQHHVSIPKVPTEDANPYDVDKLFFYNNGQEASPLSGLFFLVDTLTDEMAAALRLLEDQGIGTDINNGGGHFHCEKDSLEIKTPANANHQYNLSLYLPAQAEQEAMDMTKAYYQLIKRGGYIASPADNRHLTIRKRSVYMYAEGSVFPTVPDRLGKIANLKPDDTALTDKGIPKITHDIYRDGTALFLPIHVK